MSAPRVPKGWTREAADAVWADWQNAVSGSASIRIWCFLEHGHYRHLLTVAGYEVINPKKDREGRVLTGWVSPEARLRAWAAVGAPILTPEAQRVLEAARAMPFALRKGGEPVDPWMGLAHLVEALRAESACLDQLAAEVA